MAERGVARKNGTTANVMTHQSHKRLTKEELHGCRLDTVQLFSCISAGTSDSDELRVISQLAERQKARSADLLMPVAVNRHPSLLGGAIHSPYGKIGNNDKLGMEGAGCYMKRHLQKST